MQKCKLISTIALWLVSVCLLCTTTFFIFYILYNIYALVFVLFNLWQQILCLNSKALCQLSQQY
jgi:hypothetical protein